MASTDLADYDATSLCTAGQDCLSTQTCQSTIVSPLTHNNKSVQSSHTTLCFGDDDRMHGEINNGQSADEQESASNSPKV